MINLSNREFVSRKYELIATLQKLVAFETNIRIRSEAPRANMIVLRSTFHSESPEILSAIRSTVPRFNHSIVYIVHHQIFFRTSVKKKKNRNKLFSTFLAERRKSQMYNLKTKTDKNLLFTMNCVF